MTYITDYLAETAQLVSTVNVLPIARVVDELVALKKRNGRLYIVGNGGSAANASHAVNDFRKIADLRTYTPMDNVAELTAWINDSNWEDSLLGWGATEGICANDMIMVLSVGGGSMATSANLTKFVALAKMWNVPVVSIVSRNGGYLKNYSDVCILLPVVNEKRVTPHAEEGQSIILHLLVNAMLEKP